MTLTATGVLTTRRRRRRRRTPLTIGVALFLLFLMLVAAVIGRTLLHTSPDTQNLLAVSQAPSGAHWFGTDEIGRDVFSRVIAGARPAMIGPVIIAFSGLVISVLVGILAGYVGGVTDSVIMRTVDFIFSLPGLLLTIVVVAVTGGGYWMAIVVLSVLNAQGDIRIVRGVALEQRALPYVEAARTVGVPRWRIMYRHIFPNIAPVLVADFAVDFAGALVALSGLAFLGLGSQPGTAEWGRMLTDGQALLFDNPMAAIAPGLAIVVLAVSVNLIGDWMYERYSNRDLRSL
ncbi:ABC transporter permease [Nakamurella sp. PAMC28650]|uniref:ABC transporter permease n=1 Tax=Nakamurella sp. PAMC28650 TaxID=2762325 RepID=UPI00164D0675|nr:ABC transporter permease [Nakamurella sp. PAMC28650]QNK81560.1 ABC transporter permease [Nakamurella sp. PAMC28650]